MGGPGDERKRYTHAHAHAHDLDGPPRPARAGASPRRANTGQLPLGNFMVC